jgi:hypothetical protein
LDLIGYSVAKLVTYLQTNAHMKKQKSCFILLCALLVSQVAIGQWQVWNGLAVKARLTEKIDARLSHFRGFELQPKFNNHFHMTTLSTNIELTKRWEAGTGVMLITPTINNDTRTRFFVRAAYTYRINKGLNWINSVRLETNSANENRFRHRVILASRLGMRRRTDFLAMKASGGFFLFYNIGGSPLKYYDDKGDLMATNTPDGFHRVRLFLNLDFKLSKLLNLDINYFNQNEFNLLTSNTRKMNVPNARGRIQRPFDNYNVISASLTVNIDQLINN